MTARSVLSVRPSVFALGALLLAMALWGVYGQGLGGPFVGDDIPNILDNPGVAIDAPDADGLLRALVSNSSGPGGRPLPALSFALSYWGAGGRFDPFAFKVVNLSLHAANAVLVGLLTLALLQIRNGPTRGADAVTAAAVTAVWALHPLQLTTVLYAVQRMNAMAAFFVLAGLLVAVHGRLRMHAAPAARGPRVQYLAGLAAGLVLGVFCKENAVAIVAFAVAVETLHAGAAPSPATRFARLGLGVTIGAGVLLAALAGAFVFGFWAEQYAARDYTMSERLLTQLRILWWYVAQTFVPQLSQLGFFHDDFAISRGWLQPATTLLAAAGWAGVLAGAVAARRRAPWFTFACVWFLGGHALEASVVPLEQLFEHRHYLPSLGLILAAAVAVRHALRARARAALVLALTVLALFAATTFVRASAWSDALSLFSAEVRHHPRSVHARTTLASVLQRSGAPPGLAYEQYRSAAALNPAGLDARIGQLRLVAALELDLAAGIGPLDLRGADGNPVLEPDPAALAAERRRLDAEVQLLAARGGLAVGAVTALVNVAECALAGAPACVALAEPAGRWLDRAVQNPRVESRHRLLLQWAAARLHVAHGRARRALAIMEAAQDAHPRDAVVRAQYDAVKARANTRAAGAATAHGK